MQANWNWVWVHYIQLDRVSHLMPKLICLLYLDDSHEILDFKHILTFNTSKFLLLWQSKTDPITD